MNHGQDARATRFASPSSEGIAKLTAQVSCLQEIVSRIFILDFFLSERSRPALTNPQPTRMVIIQFGVESQAADGRTFASQEH